MYRATCPRLLRPAHAALAGLVLLALALAQPAAASSLYHDTCVSACNGAYAHCCAHVTGVIGESPPPLHPRPSASRASAKRTSPPAALRHPRADARRVPGRRDRARRRGLLTRAGDVHAGVRKLLRVARARRWTSLCLSALFCPGRCFPRQESPQAGSARPLHVSISSLPFSRGCPCSLRQFASRELQP